MRRICSVLLSLSLFGVFAVFLGGCTFQDITGNVNWGATTIGPNTVLRFDAAHSTTLTMSGNLIIQGGLQMIPSGPGVVHKIVFATADETQFVGGGTTPLASDEGLWVTGAGGVDIEGSAKTPWVRAQGSLAIGDTAITLNTNPSGWQVGDVISVVPTSEGAAGTNDFTGFDDRTISSITGGTPMVVHFATGLTYAHPSVTLPAGGGTPAGGIKTAEILNLTRNVQIEGKAPHAVFPTATSAPNNNGFGRAHIFFNNTSPVSQIINYAAIRYMGPRQYNSGTGGSDYVLGRYGLHFHMSGANDSGSTVTGTVVRDSGSHAFVPHMSDGITFTKTIAYNDAETPYWWDVKANEEGFLNNDPTNNTQYVSTIAARINTDPVTPSDRLAGYSMSCGSGNGVTTAVAVGVMGHVQTSAILWPEGANDCPNTWNVDTDIGHNNQGDGLFSWQNDVQDPHDQTKNFLGYRNGGACIENGAYRNRFRYLAATCVDNAGGYHPAWNNPQSAADVVSRAAGPAADGTDNAQHIDNIWIRGGNRFPNAFRIAPHRNAGGEPIELHNWNVDGYTGTAVAIDENNGPDESNGVAYDFICWTTHLTGELQPASFTLVSQPLRSTIRVQTKNNGAFLLSFNGTTPVGTPIANFATC